MNQRGFTLVEMLVALTIFALLAAAGVGLLRSSVDTQQAVGGKLADLAESERLRTLLASDLGQALDRPSRDESGASRPAFTGDERGMRLVRTGWSGADGNAALQAVAWRIDGDRLVRQGSASIDGRADGVAASLLSDVEWVAFGYRAVTGDWRTAWAPAASEAPLPSAVEVLLKRRGEAEVRIVLAVAPSAVPVPPQPSAAPTSPPQGAVL